ncbi:MAG: serine hydrolase [Pseudomonadota bacterium]
MAATQTRKDPQQTQPAAPQEPPRTDYSNPLERNAPIGTIAGQYKPMPAAEGNEAIAAALEGFIEETESFGILVWHAGRLVHEAYADGFDASIRGESASMAKSALALAVGAALTDGAIASVEEPVSTYVIEWKGQPRGDIKIKHLLEMSSGLKPLSFEGGQQSDLVQFLTNGPRARDIVLSMTPAHPPGTVFHYQNAVSQLLGLIVERATGETYDAYVSRRLWKPLGADDAYVWYNEEEGFPRTYMGLYARPRDWLRLGFLIKDFGAFDGVQILPRSFIEAMTAPSPANPNYGWQIWRGATFQSKRFYNDAKLGFSATASEPFAVDDMLYFDGFGGQRVYVSRSQDLIVVRLGQIRSDWDDTDLPNRVIKALGAG